MRSNYKNAVKGISNNINSSISTKIISKHFSKNDNNIWLLFMAFLTTLHVTLVAGKVYLTLYANSIKFGIQIILNIYCIENSQIIRKF